MAYYAHSLQNADVDCWQGLEDHLRAVAKLARSHADKFGAGPWGEAAGLLHDIGKYSDAFQARLAGDPSQVDHSTAGAQVARRRYGIAGHLLAAAIAGHHAGLANGTEAGERTSLTNRLAAGVPDYSAWQNEIALPELAPPRLSQHPTVERSGSAFNSHTLAGSSSRLSSTPTISIQSGSTQKPRVGQLIVVGGSALTCSEISSPGT